MKKFSLIIEKKRQDLKETELVTERNQYLDFSKKYNKEHGVSGPFDKKFKGDVGKAYKSIVHKKNESVNEAGESDDTVMIKIGGEKGKYWPWYLKKIDSTHFSMANDKKFLNTGSAMVHHVGQHRSETYYKSLVDWLHGKIKSNQLNGKEFKGNG